MTKPLILSPLELDALRETGNMGAARAATALSSLMGRSVNIDVPRVAVVSLDALPSFLGGDEALVAAVYFRLTGEAPGCMVLLLDGKTLGPLLSALMASPVASALPLSAESESALKELGNILCGSYLNAMSDLVGFSILLSVPALAVDMASSVLASVAADAAQHGAQALLLESRLLDWGQPIPMHLVYLPEPGALEGLLAGLARSTGVDPRGDRG
jgi:chemotaxis protein CheC